MIQSFVGLDIAFPGPVLLVPETAAPKAAQRPLVSDSGRAVPLATTASRSSGPARTPRLGRDLGRREEEPSGPASLRETCGLRRFPGPGSEPGRRPQTGSRAITKSAGGREPLSSWARGSRWRADPGKRAHLSLPLPLHACRDLSGPQGRAVNPGREGGRGL